MVRRRRRQGEWKANRRHGFGVLLGAGGNSYQGEWCKDKKHGRHALPHLDPFDSGIQVRTSSVAHAPDIPYELSGPRGTWIRSQVDVYSASDSERLKDAR